MILEKNYYLHEDVVALAKDLLGKILVTRFDDQLCRARIVETEAYEAPEDSASHAYNWKRSPRNESMYAEGGTLYMYICYGIHQMTNVVTGPKDLPHAVLIRAVEPLEGLEVMKSRRKLTELRRNLTAGPGLLSEAMGLHKRHDGIKLWDVDSPVIIESDGIEIEDHEFIASGPCRMPKCR